MKDIEPRLLDVDETRIYLGNVSKSLIRAYVKHKILRPVPMPNAANDGTLDKPLFDVKDLDAIIDKAKEGSWADEDGAKEAYSNHGEGSPGISSARSTESKENRREQNRKPKPRKSSEDALRKFERDYHLTPAR